MPAVRWEATPDMGLHMLKTWVLSFSGRFLLVVTPSSAMEGVCQPLTEQLHGASGCLPVCLSVDVSARARALSLSSSRSPSVCVVRRHSLLGTTLLRRHFCVLRSNPSRDRGVLAACASHRSVATA